MSKILVKIDKTIRTTISITAIGVMWKIILELVKAYIHIYPTIAITCIILMLLATMYGGITIIEIHNK